MKQPRLWIPKGIYQHLVEEADKWMPLETGGAFMGYITENQDVVITDMIGAGENAVHSKHGFTPDQDYQLREMENIYYKSNGTKNYLGDWHTHPHGSTDLSHKDKKTLTRIATTPESQSLYPIMVILGGRQNKWTMNAVQFNSGKIHLWSYAVCKYKQFSHIVF